MSLFGRLFGAKAAPPPPPNTITVDADVAVQLAVDGVLLQDAANTALRDYLEAKRKALEEPPKHLEGIPFWLRRDDGSGGEIDEELRDRVIQRQAADEAERGG